MRYLAVASIPLKSAFDTISLAYLWGKLQWTSIDFFSSDSGSQTSVWYGSKGGLTRKIPLRWGGCVLAPQVFNLYINDLKKHLLDACHHSPSLSDQNIPTGN